jgi:FSR family fosmidomycin resistance protein-like MFS transporter
VGGAFGFTIGPLIVVVALNLLTLDGTPWLMIGGWAASAILFACLTKVSIAPTEISVRDSWSEGLRAMKPILLPVAGITIMRGMLLPATFTFLPTYLTEQGMDLWYAGLAVSVCAGAGMIGSLVGGSLSDRWGRRFVLAAFLVATPLLVFALLGVTGWALLPVLVALGIVIPPAQVILLALVQETSTSNRAYATGLYLSLAFFSESAGSVAVGVLGDLFGLRLAIAISAAILVPSLPLVLLLPGRQKAAEVSL